MQQIITIIAPTFFGIAAGFLFHRFSRASAKTIIDVAMYVAVPCLVFTSMLSNPIVVRDAAKLWAACLLNLGGCFVIARIVFSFDRKKHSGLYLPIVFSNLLFIAVPILYLAFGTEGLTNAVLYYIPNGVLLYSLAIYVAAGRVGLKQGLRELVRTPLIYAVLLGLALNLAGVTLPSLVMNSFKFVGQAGTPLLLLVLGMNMSGIRISHLRLTLVASVIRMGGGFALGLLAVWLLGLTGVPRAAVIFESAMPAAFISAVACTKYDNEAELVSSVVLFTTLLSVAVAPALLYYLT
jgi:predicted permease